MPDSFLYAIQSTVGGPVKIGWVASLANLPGRLKSLQTGNPLPLRVIWTQPGTLEDEARLHATFASHRLAGEWFEATKTIAEHFGAVYSLGGPSMHALYAHAFEHGWERGFDDGHPCERCGAVLCECAQTPADRKREKKIEARDAERSWGLLA